MVHISGVVIIDPVFIGQLNHSLGLGIIDVPLGIGGQPHGPKAQQGYGGIGIGHVACLHHIVVPPCLFGYAWLPQTA